MWLEIMKRKGVNISLWSYLKVGAVLSIVEVVVASVVLWIEISPVGVQAFLGTTTNEYLKWAVC